MALGPSVSRCGGKSDPLIVRKEELTSSFCKFKGQETTLLSFLLWLEVTICNVNVQRGKKTIKTNARGFAIFTPRCSPLQASAHL